MWYVHMFICMGSRLGMHGEYTYSLCYMMMFVFVCCVVLYSSTYVHMYVHASCILIKKLYISMFIVLV